MTLRATVPKAAHRPMSSRPRHRSKAWSLVTGHWSLVTGHWSLVRRTLHHVDPIRSDRARHGPGHAAEAAQDTVARVVGRREHAGAATVDHQDALSATQSGGILRDAALAQSAVHPDLPDAQRDAFVHGVERVFWARADDDAVQGVGDVGEARVGMVDFDGVGVGVTA